MRHFDCPNCQHQVYFENTSCIHCHAQLGFDPVQMTMVVLDNNSDYQYCTNAQHQACNWLVASLSKESFCLSCQLNHTIPDIGNKAYLAYWQKIESAKRRLVYSLIQFNLPVAPKMQEDGPGIWFDFLADQQNDKVTTGHNQGLITLNINEADSVARESTKKQMGEAYRTLLGHFRHEIGHYYWDVLIAPNDERLNQCRALFGDERSDYGQALQTHYERENTMDWTDDHVSFYASSHPWEDWAETWAHYMHIVDALDTANQFGLIVNQPNDDSKIRFNRFDPYQFTDIDTIINHWLPMTYALNSVNRSMGIDDFYPFVLSPTVINKLAFVHKAISSSSSN